LGKTLNAIFYLGAKQSTSYGGLSLTKDMQTEQLLCWNGMTEHSTTSGSNEEDKIWRFLIKLSAS